MKRLTVKPSLQVIYYTISLHAVLVFRMAGNFKITSVWDLPKLRDQALTTYCYPANLAKKVHSSDAYVPK